MQLPATESEIAALENARFWHRNRYQVKEKKDWHGGVLTPENWSQTGHYTQMVWKNTQEVGCGTGSGDGHPFNILVCRYSPAGNFMGQAPF